MSNAYICNTPFQLYNAVNMVENDVELSKNNSDLFLVTRFNVTQKFVENIKTSGVFNKVIIVKPVKSKNTLREKFKKIINGYKRFEFSDDSFYKDKYEKMFIGDAAIFSRVFYKKHKNISLYLYDDGTASYRGNVLTDGYIGSDKKIMKFLKKDVFSLKPKKIYLNCPNFAKITLECSLCEIPNLKHETIKKLKNIFSFKENNNLYKANKFIFLDQMFNEIDGCDEVDISKLINDDFVVRVHPRDKTDFSKYKLDDVNNMWELESIDSINDDHCLVSLLSTAQLTPKLLNNKEPYTIFLYKLFLHDNDYIQMNNEIVERFTKTYINKKKIYIPETFEEYRSILERIKNEQ